MHFNIPAFTLALALIVLRADARPDGAPKKSCDSMSPSHGFEPRSSPCPYVTEPQQLSIDSNGMLTLKLRHSANADDFKGFLLQAHDIATSKSIGTFEVSANGKTLNCFGGVNTAATHADELPKKEVEVAWIPPKDYEGYIVFKTTFAKNFTDFWIGQPSIPVRVVRTAGDSTLTGVAGETPSTSAALLAVYGIVIAAATIAFML